MPPFWSPRPHRPPADVVLYDGRCRICTAQAELLRRLDLGGRLTLLSLHDPAAARWFPELRPADLVREVHVVLPGGRAVRGGAAIRRICRRVPTLWPVALILALPGAAAAADRALAWLAVRRDRLSCAAGKGRLSLCARHDARVRKAWP